MAAAYYETVSSAQFTKDPDAELFRNTGWGVWYSEERPDAFLTTLYAIHGERAYLVYSGASYTWQVEGTARKPDVQWQANAYNFMGFPVHAQAAPTFAQFFSGSDAHDLDRIYRLVDGAWKKVTVPDGETMRSGEAFWIYCDGASSYMGPLRVETASHFGLIPFSGKADLILRNDTEHPVTATLEHVGSTNSVPLAIVIQALADASEPIKYVETPLPDGAWTQPLPPLEARRAIRVPLTVRSVAMTTEFHSSLVKVTTDIGTEVWVPVIGNRKDLKEN